MNKIKLIAYNTADSTLSDNSIKELIALCAKILQSNQTICILVVDREIAHKISTKMWTAAAFIPHGLAWEDFADIQPIIISTDILDRDVLINFEQVVKRHSYINSAFKTFILWNCEIYSNEFDIFIQNSERKWIRNKIN